MDAAWIVSAAALMSGVGACASALATFLSVREMKKHREASCKPDLVFSACVFSGEGLTEYPSDENVAEFTVHNIGMGGAKNIVIKVTSNISDLLPSLNAAAKEYGVHISLDEELRITWTTEGSEYSHAVSKKDIAYIRHLAANAPDGVKLAFPKHIHFFIDFMVRMAFVAGLRKAQYFKDILQALTITFEAEFRDVGEKAYRTVVQNAFVDCRFGCEDGKYLVRFI